MKAQATLTVDPGLHAECIRWCCAPPIVFRQTGPNRVHLVQAAGGPLGGDDLRLDVRLGERTCLQVRSAGATVVQPSSPAAPAQWIVAADLGDGAVLKWCPEPIVVCDGAELLSSMTIALHREARAVLHEIVVLGRAGQRGGCFRGELTVQCDGVPLLAHTLLLDGADAVLTGPAGTGGARVVGMLAVVGKGIGCPPQVAGEQSGLRWACSALDGPGWLLVALGDQVTDVTRLLDQVSPSWSDGGYSYPAV